MDQIRKLPPAWLLGLSNLPLGVSGGLMLFTLPQLLAARHVPEPRIAQLTTLFLVPSFLVFLLGPVVDVKFKRRTYAAGAVILCAVATYVALVFSDRLEILGVLLFFSSLGATLNGIATGGWFGSIMNKEDDAKLGAWLIAANVGGFGVITLVAILVLRALPMPIAAVVVSAPILLPLFIYPITPAPAPDDRLLHESFGRFLGDLTAIVRQPRVLQLLLLFVVPAASFALTNTLGGLGRDYSASEKFVAGVGGFGVTIAGLFGSLLIMPIGKRVEARKFYLSVAAIGAVFTLSLIFMPHTPLFFGVAVVGQNVAQSAALALNYAIALQSLGKDNPFAATQFGLLTNAAALPITYMQWFDGQAYGKGGLTAMYLTDGLCGLVAASVMTLLLWLWTRKRASAIAE
ncbi:MAG TPA: MFS transporter [Caulobacteraceae bacterium]|jgi:PAT family beta-lactamase induction signal transducer AmpG|nr:MFS transporter [Caulobacteraceae bacterium]